MTKEEWKKQLIELLANEPEVGADRVFPKEDLATYLFEIQEKADPYYGIGWELIIAIEILLEK